MSIDKEQLYTGLLELKERNIPAKNNISHYLPYRNKGADFSYPYVFGKLCSYLAGQTLNPHFSTEALRDAVADEVAKNTIEGDLAELVKQIYFQAPDTACKIAPIFSILHTVKGDEKFTESSKQLASIFCHLIGGEKITVKHPPLNFLEDIIAKQFGEKLTALPSSPTSAIAYLPYLAETFKSDLSFLCSQPSYFLNHAEDFLALYNFLYCSQLGANIRNWKSGQPEPREFFFIIDTERCSAERRASTDYDDLRQSVENIFPMLTLVHELNQVLPEVSPTVPLWHIRELLEELTVNKQEEVKLALDSYSSRFARTSAEEENGRGLHPRERLDYNSEALGSLEMLVQYYMDQFDSNREITRSTKHQMKSIKYMRPFENEVARNFIQARGRIGNVLVMNQDYLLMLTNIVIGNNGEMRLQEVLKEFKQRGIGFDMQSQQNLIAFYERIGNIKRMSDSGDAVYIKSTV